MGTYTKSILDILQENAGDRELSPLSPDFVANVRDIAKEHIFGASLNALDEKYRDVFAAGFCFNYMYDEIGIETLSGWQLALVGRLHNNASFINQIYATMDKQIFANYSTTRSTRDGVETRQEVGKETGTREDKELGATGTAETGSGTVATEDNTSTDSTSTTLGTSANSETRAGTDAVTKTGTDSTDTTSKDSTKHGRTDTRDATLTDTYNNLKVQNSGALTETLNNTLTFNDRGSVVNDETWTKFSQTPQQGLSGVKDGTYLTTANLDEKSTTTTERGSERNASDTTRNDNTASTTSGSVDHADRSTNTASGTDVVDSVGNSTTTHNATDSATREETVTSEGSTDNTTTAKTTGSGDSTQTTTRDFATDTTSSRDVTGKDSRDRETTGNVDSTEEVTQESYDLSYEMLTVAQPLLKRTWALFDNLFLALL